MSFLFYSLAAGSIMALLAGPLGSLMLWNRFSYFSDAMGHTAILGVALGVLLSLPVNFSVFATVLAASLIFLYLLQKKSAPSDTLLGIIAQAGLSLGIICLACIGTGTSRMMAYLFGDILATTKSDLIYISVSAVIIAVTLAVIWKKLLLLAFDETAATAEHGKMPCTRIAFIFTLALFISLAIKTTGILLVTALLIIPAAAVKSVSRTPEQMAVFAALLGMLSVWTGFAASYFFDLPTGPSIVLAAAFCGTFTYILKKLMTP
jgi:zinc transport system permease protein